MKARRPKRGEKPWQGTIVYRTVLLCWILIIITLGLYVTSIIPYQRKAAIQRMKTQAGGIASSIGQVTANAIFLEDYSFAVDHCLKVVSEAKSIEYVVITKKDGFSLVHTRDGWRSGSLSGLWTPNSTSSSESQITYSGINEKKVFHYTYAFNYSGIQWGWIHIGLSLEDFNKHLREMVKRSLWFAFLCGIVGLGFSILFARKLSLPIKTLDQITRKVADGDLSARVELSTGDELESLAASFNRMTEALEKSRDELEQRVAERTAELAKINAALHKEIAERKRAEETISASLQEKEILLNEVHHRVKNNLQIISSLLYLQSRKISDQETLDLFRESQNRVKSMALIHEKLYQSENLANINISEYIRSLTNYLFHAYQARGCGIELIADIEEVLLDIEQAIPCGLIINELVSNSLKYAFPEERGGRIEISLFAGRTNGSATVTMMVRDDGIGISEGIDYLKTSSLGLQLVTSLTKQLNGSIELNRENGTAFKIVFDS